MIVIADDITGAAEIAGIAFSKGHQVSLVCGEDHGDGSQPSSLLSPPSSLLSPPSTNTTTVIATDTRSMSEADAVAETRRILPSLLGEGLGERLFFKKTDSALRGHVVAELSALMSATGYQRAVYLPANPSKGRIIKNGIYYINNVPIHETDFSFDPEFPARTSVLKERFPDAEANHIIMPDAESIDDIRRVIATYDDGKTLFAGAADLFSALLDGRRREEGGGWRENSPCTVNDRTVSNLPPPSTLIPPPSSLVLCGSTQSKPQDLGIPICEMPREVYDGHEGADYWLAHSTLIPPPSSLLLSIPYTHRTGKAVAVHLRTVMTEMAKHLITTHYLPSLPGEGSGERLSLIIEGGATAWATLQALGWTQFDIVAQLAPGVVQMRAANGTLVTLKPGSYPWGNIIL